MNEFDNLIENYQVNYAQILDLIHHSYQLNCKKSNNQVNCKKPTKLIVNSNQVYSIIVDTHKKQPVFFRYLFACTLFFAKNQAWTTQDPPPGLCQQTERALKLQFHKQVLHKLRRLHRIMGTKGMQR
jgi:hypothetical protein